MNPGNERQNTNLSFYGPQYSATDPSDMYSRDGLSQQAPSTTRQTQNPTWRPYQPRASVTSTEIPDTSQQSSKKTKIPRPNSTNQPRASATSTEIPDSSQQSTKKTKKPRPKSTNQPQLHDGVPSLQNPGTPYAGGMARSQIPNGFGQSAGSQGYSTPSYPATGRPQAVTDFGHSAGSQGYGTPNAEVGEYGGEPESNAGGLNPDLIDPRLTEPGMNLSRQWNPYGSQNDSVFAEGNRGQNQHFSGDQSSLGYAHSNNGGYDAPQAGTQGPHYLDNRHMSDNFHRQNQWNGQGYENVGMNGVPYSAWNSPMPTGTPASHGTTQPLYGAHQVGMTNTNYPNGGSRPVTPQAYPSGPRYPQYHQEQDQGYYGHQADVQQSEYPIIFNGSTPPQVFPTNPNSGYNYAQQRQGYDPSFNRYVAAESDQYHNSQQSQGYAPGYQNANNFMPAQENRARSHSTTGGSASGSHQQYEGSAYHGIREYTPGHQNGSNFMSAQENRARSHSTTGGFASGSYQQYEASPYSRIPQNPVFAPGHQSHSNFNPSEMFGLPVPPGQSYDPANITNQHSQHSSSNHNPKSHNDKGYGASSPSIRKASKRKSEIMSESSASKPAILSRPYKTYYRCPGCDDLHATRPNLK